MIKTKKKIFTNRDGFTSEIFITISEPPHDDLDNDKWLFVVKDYVINKGEKLFIHTKIQEMSYQQRDAVKQIVLQNYEVAGNSESEINKNILPYALLFLTASDPCYGLTFDDFELNI